MFGLRIQRSEIAITLSLASYFFLLVASHYLIKPARNAMFLEDLGADNLPYVYIGTALVTWLAMAAYVRVAPGIRLVRLFRGTLIFLALNLVAFWWFLPICGNWLLAVFYIWVKLYAVLLPSQFWLLANELLDPRKAKRLFGPLGAGGILGSIAGSALAAWIAEALGTQALLLAGVVGLAAGLLMLQVVLSKSTIDGSWLDSPVGVDEGGAADDAASEVPPSGDIPASSRPPVNGAAGNRKLDAGGRSTRPLVVMITALLAITFVAHTFVDWQFNKAAEIEIDNLDERTAFFGYFFTLLNFVTLVVQLAATSFVLRVFGLGAALALLPAAMAMGAFGILLHPGLWSATLARGADDALRYSVDQSARELLFLPLPSSVRVRLKPRIDLIASRAANGVAGVVILIVVATAADPLRTLSVFTLVSVAVWLLIAQRARSYYARSLQHLLTVRDVDVAYLAQARLDADAHDAIQDGLRSNDPATVNAAMGLVAHTNPVEFVDELRALLQKSSDSRLRARALHLLTESGDQSAVGEALEILAQPDRSLTAEALAYACAAGEPSAEQQIASYLDGEDPMMAIAAAVCLLEQPDFERQQRGIQILERASASSGAGDPARVRKTVADTIRARPSLHGLHGILSQLLADEDLDVVRAALIAAARHRDPTTVKDICTAGLRRTLRAPALQALRSMGPEAAGALTGILADPRSGRPARRLAARALSRIGGAPAADGLVAGLLADDPAVRGAALKGLNHMRRRGQRVDLGEAATQAVLDMEWTAFLSLHRIAAAVVAPGVSTSAAFVSLVVQERMEGALERLFRALALCHPIQTVFFAYQGLVTGDPGAQANAIELVDSTVEGPMRRPLVEILEESDTEKRGKLAAIELGLPMPEPDEALWELIDPGDPWLAASVLSALGPKALSLPRGLRQDLLGAGYRPLAELLEAEETLPGS